jgi:hypothetical protein
LLPYGHNTVDNPMGPYIKMDPWSFILPRKCKIYVAYYLWVVI